MPLVVTALWDMSRALRLLVSALSLSLTTLLLPANGRIPFYYQTPIQSLLYRTVWLSNPNIRSASCLFFSFELPFCPIISLHTQGRERKHTFPADALGVCPTVSLSASTTVSPSCQKNSPGSLFPPVWGPLPTVRNISDDRFPKWYSIIWSAPFEVVMRVSLQWNIVSSSRYPTLCSSSAVSPLPSPCRLIYEAPVANPPHCLLCVRVWRPPAHWAGRPSGGVLATPPIPRHGHREAKMINDNERVRMLGRGRNIRRRKRMA